MNDTVREYTSYWKFLIPYLRFQKTVTPIEHRWGDKDRYFLFFPAQNKKEDKLVIYLHGGGWNSNSPKLHNFVGQKIASQGYDCVMLGYRKVPKALYDEISDDVFKGYDVLRSFLQEKGLAYSKVVVSGSSAGGHLGALLCFDEEKKEKYGIADDEFAGLISMAGPVCFSYPQTGTLDHLLKGLFGTKDRKVWKKGEPITKMTAAPKLKVKVVQSKHDGLVGYEQAFDFYEKAKSLGLDAEFYDVTDKWDTHSAYCVGIFLTDAEKSNTLRKVFEMIEEI